jgi:PAS domain S-box-containing protein
VAVGRPRPAESGIPTDARPGAGAAADGRWPGLPVTLGERVAELKPLDSDLADRVFRGTPIGMALVTAPGTITWANPAYFEMTGRGTTLLGMDFHDIPEMDGTWSPMVRNAMDAALISGASARFQSVRTRYRERAGGVFLDVDVRPLEHRAGEPRRGVVRVWDVTERVKEHDRALLFYESFRSSTNAMQLTDARGIMLDVNPAFEKIYGYSREECLGQNASLVRDPQTSPEVYQEMWADLLDPARGSWSGEILNRDRNGAERPVLLSITAIRYGTAVVTHYLGVAVDLSQQRNWELRAAHPDRLIAVGQLAAGVAHEINTPLANVMLVAESLRRRSSDPWVLRRLDTMTTQIEVAARIVRGLLDFARREEPHTTDLDLVEVAKEAVGFLRGKQSADVDIVETYPQGSLWVLADRGQLVQVFTNILNNAYDAMDGAGRIEVAVRARGDRAEVEIIDHGPGIAVEALSQIFEPFFTTKAEGGGTGLGLAISHGIIQSHHGTIEARNVPGAGAGFLLSLPLRTLAPSGDDPLAPAELPAGERTPSPVP